MIHSASALTAGSRMLDPAWREGLVRACASIAPSWPLDRMIAVNPLWEQRQRPLAEVAARMSALRGARCLMPAEYYLERWQIEIQPHHLQRAARELDVNATPEALVLQIQEPGCAPTWQAVSDWLDQRRATHPEMPWRDEITHQISQFCAHFFQAADQRDELAPQGLYREWLAMVRRDRGIAILMREPRIMSGFRDLPEDAEMLLHEALEGLGVPADRTELLGQALLLSISGWASWIAYLRWESRLQGQTEDLMLELLAIRLAWEWVLWQVVQHDDSKALSAYWRLQLQQLPDVIAQHAAVQKPFWVWQRAAELAYQESLQAQLLSVQPNSGSAPLLLQAAFCIDVRSEVYRRALECQHPGIQTLGFAGFFGLPLSYEPAGTLMRRPQLPGLLAPTVQVRETEPAVADAVIGPTRLNRQARWQAAWNSPAAAFSLVESVGLLKAFQMVKDTWFPAPHQHPVGDLARGRELRIEKAGQALSFGDKADLAATILKAMGLTGPYARTVLLVGHGSESRNNPHAAGLDCGACGGQTGELNVRVLATLLNEPAVREQLQARGLEIPAETRFVPALHNTTTDEIECFGEVGSIAQSWLKAASHRCRIERAPALGIDERRPEPLHQELVERSRDWSQVRPEWGLANNAAFIVAPRVRTRHLDLQGRSFLHDYTWHQDEGFRILELILTAPMVVTHWINMQYNLSTTDNVCFGSGNKVLHNVVGGRLGVFEGNGGDLRVGLSLQSLHDGQRWMHQPLRLSVYVAAPSEAIAEIVSRHELVRHLIDHDWLTLFRLDDEAQQIERLYRGQWTTVANRDGLG